MAVMTNLEFVEKLKDVANNYKTLYVMGCFGSPMTKANKERYCNNHTYNMKETRTAMIQKASADTFGFDCVNLIKGILWGWVGDKTKTYGGAKYKANGVPDVSADGMIAKCTDLSTDFSDIEIGEAVWLPGHIGVYIGDGLAVECTPSFKNKVQITACNCSKSGYSRRNWLKHGRIPYVEYIKAQKTIEEIADEVIAGKWGAGDTRKQKLADAGYDYRAVQDIVNQKLKQKAITDVAKEVIDGKWGNGADRKRKLVEAGYDYKAVQDAVNELLK